MRDMIGTEIQLEDLVVLGIGTRCATLRLGLVLYIDEREDTVRLLSIQDCHIAEFNTPTPAEWTRTIKSTFDSHRVLVLRDPRFTLIHQNLRERAR